VEELFREQTVGLQTK